MSAVTNVYFPIDLFDSDEDVEVIKYKLNRFSQKLGSRLKKEDFDYIINFAIKILYEYFDKDSSMFFTIQDLKKYIQFCMLTVFWISYKFLADEDDLYAGDFCYKLKVNMKEFLAKEREVLLFIDYNLFKYLKSFNNELYCYKTETMRRASI